MNHWHAGIWYKELDDYTDDELTAELERRERKRTKRSRESAAAKAFGVSREQFRDIQTWVLKEEARNSGG